MDNAEDWRVMEAERGRKMYYNIKSGCSTFEKPNVLKTMAELQRDENIRNGIFDEDVLRDFDDCAEKSSSNDMKSSIGYELLKKQGWTETNGLGKSEQGIVEPVSVRQTERGAGLGSNSSALTESELNLPETSCERRKLDVEYQGEAVDVRQRDEEAKRQEALKDDIKSMNREFYCEVCDKQYKNVAEMSNHLSSYDHHHKKRFKEMRAATKRDFEQSEEATESKRRKEARREEKQMADRMQMALKAQEDASTHLQSKTIINTSSSISKPSTGPIVIKFGLKKKK